MGSSRKKKSGIIRFLGFEDPVTVLEDTRGIYHPVVVEFKGKFFLYYTYGDSPPPDHPRDYTLKIGVAVIEDAGRFPYYWKRMEEPVLDLNPDSESPDHYFVACPYVLNLWDMFLLMYYDGYNIRHERPDIQSCVLTALSTDGVKWMRLIPVLVNLEREHHVERCCLFTNPRDGLHYLFYTAYTDPGVDEGLRHYINLAVGSSHLQFKRLREGSVLKGRAYEDMDPNVKTLLEQKSECPEGLFDDQSLRQPRVFQWNGYYAMFYGGSRIPPPKQEVYKTGVALSRDLITWGRSRKPLNLPDDEGQGVWLEESQDQNYLFYSNKNSIKVVKLIDKGER